MITILITTIVWIERHYIIFFKCCLLLHNEITCGARHANVFSVFCHLSCHLVSQKFRPSPLSPGLAISALVCLDFAFKLVSFVISFSWHHLYLAFAHVQTISTPSLFSLMNSAIGPTMCASFHMSTFLTWSSLVFPLAHHNMRAIQLCAISFLPYF